MEYFFPSRCAWFWVKGGKGEKIDWTDEFCNERRGDLFKAKAEGKFIYNSKNDYPYSENNRPKYLQEKPKILNVVRTRKKIQYFNINSK